MKWYQYLNPFLYMRLVVLTLILRAREKLIDEVSKMIYNSIYGRNLK